MPSTCVFDHFAGKMPRALRVLVTGSTRWLGQLVCRSLLSQVTSEYGVIELFATHHQTDPDWVQPDHRFKLSLSYADSILSIIENVRPDAGVHLAAISSPAVCHKDIDDAY